MSEPGGPRVVFDCVVYLQAIAGPGGPAARLLVEFVESGRLTLYLSDHVLAEVRDVLGRPKVRAKNPAITDESVAQLLDRLARLARIATDIPNVASLPRDPDDEPYLNLALAVDADYLVSRDRDLLDLMQDENFRTRHPHLTILDPVALLRVLGALSQPEP